MSEDDHAYAAFGCTLRSAWHIPGLPASERHITASDPLIRLSWTGAELAPGDHDLRAAGVCELPFGGKRLLVPGIVALELQRSDEATLDVRCRGKLQDVNSFLLRRGVPIALGMFGRLWLSASVVAINGRALLIPGGAAVGKSALAAALVATGAHLVSDHGAAVLVHADQPAAMTGTIELQLWPDVCAALELATRLGEVRSGLGKWRIPSMPAAPDHCWPLAGLVVPEVGQQASVTLSPIIGRRKLAVLTANANCRDTSALVGMMRIAQCAPMWAYARAPVPQTKRFLEGVADAVNKVVALGR